MTLIKSISGIRGTIGGKAGDNLTPLDVVKFTAAYAAFIEKYRQEKEKKLLWGAMRPSGEMIHRLVVGALIVMGFDVVDIGMATTPTT